MSTQGEIRDPETYLKDPRFNQSFQLPADQSDNHATLQVKYADYGYRNQAKPEDENILLFFAPLCASRIFHVGKDELAKKHRVRIIVMDRPGFGGTDPVKLENRAVLCRKITLALLQHLGIQHVSIACHSGGTVYALDMLLHHPEILHPDRPYIAIGAPWILPSHSNSVAMALTKALPNGLLGQADKFIGFINGTLGPVMATSAGVSQVIGNAVWKDDREPDENNPDVKFEESLEPTLFKFLHTESIRGFSDEALFLMQKANGVTGWGDWLDYDDMVPKLVEALNGASRKLTIDVFFAAEDNMIGAAGTQGPKWLNSCWEKDEVRETVTYNTTVIPKANHDTVWSIRRGVPEEVFKKIGA
ncbi:hypothetical protein FSARC_13513 [Fusarium sarcochroum]|uniref:AB hydrolase-1 domain-containing protein n=1 Tax=Fusarium sarcochroum TaxID=1208366 RepID=A0A8H4WTD8_9HYPO|nr:hypothetical protein FSARC_13513 [Fusarium sarcochroum]